VCTFLKIQRTKKKKIGSGDIFFSFFFFFFFFSVIGLLGFRSSHLSSLGFLDFSFCIRLALGFPFRGFAAERGGCVVVLIRVVFREAFELAMERGKQATSASKLKLKEEKCLIKYQQIQLCPLTQVVALSFARCREVFRHIFEDLGQLGAMNNSLQLFFSTRSERLALAAQKTVKKTVKRGRKLVHL
jgi:hypothetical protein